MDIINLPKEYQYVNNIRYSGQYHVIFCPKYRRKVLVNGVDECLLQLLHEKQDEFGYKLYSTEVMSDHVHLRIEIPPDQSVCSIIGKIKAYTSHVLREKFPELKSRLPTLWTRSYFVSSVGNVSLKEIETFVEEQKNH